LVVTPSTKPRAFAFLISLIFAVSIKIFTFPPPLELKFQMTKSKYQMNVKAQNPKISKLELGFSLAFEL
jgi:hypothetical protein